MKSSQAELTEKFQWRDRKGEFHFPEKMETRHLFYTVLMIWNHSAPESLKIRPYKKYSFPDFYTEDYMSLAVRVLSKELSKRKDLTAYQGECVIFIRNTFRKTIQKNEQIENTIQEKQ